MVDAPAGTPPHRVEDAEVANVRLGSLDELGIQNAPAVKASQPRVNSQRHNQKWMD